jgi:hypothetical protein
MPNPLSTTLIPYAQSSTFIWWDSARAKVQTSREILCISVHVTILPWWKCVRYEYYSHLFIIRLLCLELQPYRAYTKEWCGIKSEYALKSHHSFVNALYNHEFSVVAIERRYTNSEQFKRVWEITVYCFCFLVFACCKKPSCVVSCVVVRSLMSAEQNC